MQSCRRELRRGDISCRTLSARPQGLGIHRRIRSLRSSWPVVISDRRLEQVGWHGDRLSRSAGVGSRPRSPARLAEEWTWTVGAFDSSKHSFLEASTRFFYPPPRGNEALTNRAHCPCRSGSKHTDDTISTSRTTKSGVARPSVQQAILRTTSSWRWSLISQRAYGGLRSCDVATFAARKADAHALQERRVHQPTARDRAATPVCPECRLVWIVAQLLQPGLKKIPGARRTDGIRNRVKRPKRCCAGRRCRLRNAVA